MEREDIFTGSFTCTKLKEGDFTVYENIKTRFDLDKTLAKYREDRILPEDTQSLIELLIIKGKLEKRKEKLATNKIAQFFIDKYEEEIGRKIYNAIK